MTRYHTIIFVTGGVTLALELLASRILTPYFGVSLFIWAGILSITLVALAFGYWWGGRLSRRVGQDHTDLVYRFACMPAVASISLVVACLLYPKLFVPIADFHLVIGAFVACAILLLVPLVTCSAMNPLLIAIHVSQVRKKAVGDAGAGQVFFISTLGSVAGVLVTAFLLIPSSTNYRSVLVLACVLAAASLWIAATEIQLGTRRKRQLLLWSAGSAAASVGLLFLADVYLKKHTTISNNGRTWTLLEEVSNYYGNVKVVEQIERSAGTRDRRSSRTYMTDGGIQGVVDAQGRSLATYVHVLNAVGRHTVSEPKNVLILGLAAGSLPMLYSDQGAEIDVVDVNPAAVGLAERHFGYDPSVATNHVADARIFARRCTRQYDLIFVDLFQADTSTPEHVLSAEFIQDLARCLRPGGVVVFNTILELSDAANSVYYAILKTVSQSLPELAVFFLPPNQASDATNVVVAASGRSLKGLDPKVASDVPARIAPVVERFLSSRRHVVPQRLAEAQPFTDDYNVFSILDARAQMDHRRKVVHRSPSELLVN